MKVTVLPQYTLEFPEIQRQDPNYRDVHKVPLTIQISNGKAHTPYGTFDLKELRQAVDVLLAVQKQLEKDAEPKPPEDVPF